MSVDPSKPAEQGSTVQPTTDAGSSQPPSNGTGSPPAAKAVDDAERRRRTEEGRKFKELADQNAGLQSVVIGLQKQLGELGASLSAREEREIQAELASLDPEDRLTRQLQLTEQKLTRRIDAMQSRTTQPVAQGEDAVAYQNRRMQEILEDVNAEFAGAGITPEERDELAQRGVLDLTSEDTYARSLKQVAYMATRNGAQAATPPQNGHPQGGVASGQGGAMPNDQKSIDDLVEQRAQELADTELRKLGINRPNSARASIPAGPATSESYRALSSSFGSNMSPRQRKAAIEKLRAQR